MAFDKVATRGGVRMKMALVGPSGAGKTYTALAIAEGLAGKGGKIGLLDSDEHSAKIYARRFTFRHEPLHDTNPATYIKMIQAADDAGIDVLVIDSLSHAWNGKEGALSMVDAASKRTQGNKFVAWADVTPLQNALIDAIKHAKCHVICTMRAKTEYVMEVGPNGKTAPRKVGLGPIQRDGIEYEFNFMAMIDAEHNLCISNTRYEELDGKVIPRADADFGARLRKLAEEDDGTEAEEKPFTKPAAPPKASKPANGNGHAKREEPKGDVAAPPVTDAADSKPAKSEADKPWAKWQQIQIAKFAEKLGFPSDDARHEFIMAALKVPDGYTWEQVKAGMTAEQASIVANAMRAAIASKAPATK